VFPLKKLVSFWLMPLPLSMALLLSGLLLLRSQRRSRLGRGLIGAGTALLLLLSNKAVSNQLLRPLEAHYPAIPEMAAGEPAPSSIAGCRFVVVLGGGHAEMPGRSATSQLSTAALERVAEAVRLLRILPDARLIVSGPGQPGHPSHAAVLASAAESLGIDPARIAQVDTALDTEDESHAVSRIVGDARIALVTSAWHMPRAALLFRRAGVEFVPCPTDFASRDSFQLGWGDLSWDSESLERSTRAFHEWIGILWLWIRGGP